MRINVRALANLALAFSPLNPTVNGAAINIERRSPGGLGSSIAAIGRGASRGGSAVANAAKAAPDVNAKPPVPAVNAKQPSAPAPGIPVKQNLQSTLEPGSIPQGNPAGNVSPKLPAGQSEPADGIPVNPVNGKASPEAPSVAGASPKGVVATNGQSTRWYNPKALWNAAVGTPRTRAYFVGSTSTMFYPPDPLGHQFDRWHHNDTLSAAGASDIPPNANCNCNVTGSPVYASVVENAFATLEAWAKSSQGGFLGNTQQGGLCLPVWDQNGLVIEWCRDGKTTAQKFAGTGAELLKNCTTKHGTVKGNIFVDGIARSSNNFLKVHAPQEGSGEQQVAQQRVQQQQSQQREEQNETGSGIPTWSQGQTQQQTQQQEQQQAGSGDEESPEELRQSWQQPQLQAATVGAG